MTEESVKTATKISRDGGENPDGEAASTGHNQERSVEEEVDGERAATNSGSDKSAEVAEVVPPGTNKEPEVVPPGTNKEPGVVPPGTNKEPEIEPCVPRASIVQESPPKPPETEDKEVAPTRQLSGRPASRCVECTVFAVIIAVVLVVSVAIFYWVYGRRAPARVQYVAGGLPKTTVERGARVWHGYAPQLLICTLADLSPVTADTLPPDGLCDAVLYTHVDSLVDFDQKASPNVRTLWTQAKTGKRTRYGYSFSLSVLPVQEQELGTFIKNAVQDKGMRVFGMLDARWDHDITNDSYVTFAATLNSTTKLLPENQRPALMFGVHVSPGTSSNGVRFWESHAAILHHVHVLIYQSHNKQPRDDDKKPFRVTFPSPRFKQLEDSDRTMQDAVAAIDTVLHFRKFAVTNDICVSVTLSAFRFWGPEGGEAGGDVGSRSQNASLVTYADACVKGSDRQGDAKARQSNDSVTPIRHPFEGVLVKRTDANLVDAFDDTRTVAEKLRSAKLALSLTAQPHWNFCLAAFNLEHGDSAGACGNRFARLEIARSYLHGKLKRH